MILLYSSVGWPRDASDVCVRLLCAGSVYNNMTWKKRMLEKADSIAKDETLTTHSSVMLALRKVKVYRLGGEFDRSSEALRDCQDRLDNNLTAASAYKRAQSGLLAIHEAESFVHLDDHKSAIECLQTFQGQTLAQSPFEIMTRLRMWIMECRIRRYVGDLEGCEEKLRMSLEVISENQMFSGLRLETLQELADIYVETNPQAVQNLNSEWPQHYHDSSRLQVADAESLLELGKLDLAEQRFQDLGRTLQDSTKHFCLLRINVGLARISHQRCWDDPASSWKAGLQAWSKALAILTDRFSADGQGRTTAVVLLSSCDLASMQGEWVVAKNTMNQVHHTQRHLKNMPDLQRRYSSQYWLPGLGSRFFDRVRTSLQGQGWDLETLERRTPI